MRADRSAPFRHLVATRVRRVARAGAAILAVAAAFAAAGCGKESVASRPEGVLVDTTTVVSQDVPRVLRAVGTVEAENQTRIKSEVDGQVARIVADEGARVAKGQLVLQLDPTPFRLAYQDAAAQLERAQAELDNDAKLLERYTKLLETGAIGQQAYDDVEARVKSGRAAVNQARARAEVARWDLSKTSVRAPFSGQVADRLVELGAYVSEGDDLFELVDPSPVRVAFEIPETQVGALALDDPVSFTVRSQPGKVYEGRLIYTSPDLNPETRTQSAKAEYANAQAEVPPGAFADIEVVTETRAAAPVIPEAALVAEGEQNFVYVVREGRAFKTEITLGERLEGDRLEVLNGLRGGEIVVVAGHRELRDDVPVRYAEAAAAAPGEVGPQRGQTP